MRRRWSVLLVLAPMLLGSATLAQGPGPSASLVFSDQESSGRMLLVDAVRTTHGGFLVVHDDGYLDGRRVSSIIGASGALGAGLHTDVPIFLDVALERTQRVVVVVHHDSDQNKVFEGWRDPSLDPAYEVSGRTIGDQATITVPGSTPRASVPVWPFLALATIAFIVVGVGGGRIGRK